MVELTLSLVVGVVSGYIGAVSSGGGLLSIPLLIFLGLPPQSAIATNRLSSLGLSVAAITKYHKAKKIEWKNAIRFVPLAIIGGYLGSNILIDINENVLSAIIATLLLAMLPVILLKKDIGLLQRKTSAKREAVGYGVYFLLMVYGGFFGGGTGVFLISALVYFFGMTYTKANATNFIPWLLLSVSALTVFIANDLVDYRLGIGMGIGMYCGGLLGARHAIRKGDAWVRTFLAVVIVLSSVKLLIDLF